MFKYSIFLTTIVPLLAQDVVYQSQFASGDPAGVVKSLFKSIFILLILLVIFFYWQKKMLPQIQSHSQGLANMKIIDKLLLDPATMVYLVEIGSRYQLLAVSNKNVAALDSFKKSDLKLNLAQAETKQLPFKDYLKLFIKKGAKKVEKTKR